LIRTWSKSEPFKKRPWQDASRRDRSVLAGVDLRVKQIAYDRLAILREYHLRLSKPRKPKTKTQIMERFLRELDSGILWPDGIMGRIHHLGRSTIYRWDELYRNSGLAALVPRYRTKSSIGKATYRPLVNPIEMKFPGAPKARGKKDFIARIKRRWKNPTLECPIRLSIFYSMPIPKKTKMPRRMAMLKHRISHRGKPNLDALNAFIVDSMTGIVFRDHSQIVLLHSEKKFKWWPQTRILIKPLPG
jgi:Holliday junction resolvase RusA-like endonuclease